MNLIKYFIYRKRTGEILNNGLISHQMAESAIDSIKSKGKFEIGIVVYDGKMKIIKTKPEITKLKDLDKLKYSEK